MKKLLLTAAAIACAASVFAQGTVVFNTKLGGTLTVHVYLGAGPQQGNAATGDFPAGTTSWTGFTLLTGSGYACALLGANGASAAESSLTFGANPLVETFRGGVNAGTPAVGTATLNQVPVDAANATLEMFAWNDVGGTIMDPNVAMTEWLAGTIAGGKSGAFNVAAIGGLVNTTPALVGLQSFSIYTVPEPSTMALAGLGAAALLIFRRRK